MFLQAGSPAELRAYMAQYPDSRCIAGGTDIMPVQNRENDHEAVFIDISGAAALHRIVSEDGVLSVGAAATFAEIERNALLRQYAPVLCLAASQVGSPQIRNLGTIGGNVAHGSPAADTLPVLAMLDAEVRLYSATEGTCRDIPVDTFITGPGQTLLRPGEYIEALRFSPPEASWRMAYEKVGRRNALAISRLSACCAARWEGQRLTGLRLALDEQLVVRDFDLEAVRQHHDLANVGDGAEEIAHRAEDRVAVGGKGQQEQYRRQQDHHIAETQRDLRRRTLSFADQQILVAPEFLQRGFDFPVLILWFHHNGPAPFPKFSQRLIPFCYF